MRAFRPRQATRPMGAAARRPHTVRQPRALARASARLGRQGERQAARCLRRLGYRIVARNLELPPAEIDLLALHGDTLVVIEVKSGRRASPGALRRRLGTDQRERLDRALRWLRRTPAGRNRRLRADLALVRGVGRRATVEVVCDVLGDG